MNLTTFVQSIIHTNTCRPTQLYIALRKVTQRACTLVVPTFNFTITLLMVQYLSLLYLELIAATFRTSRPKFLNNIIYIFQVYFSRFVWTSYLSTE